MRNLRYPLYTDLQLKEWKLIVTKEDLVENLKVGEVFSNSDHRGITFHINFIADEINKNDEQVPDYRRANFRKLRSLFNQIDWSYIQTNTDINAQWKIFTDKYLKIV